MAVLNLDRTQRWTIPSLVLELRNSLSDGRMQDVTRDTVMQAVREQGIPIKDGRIDGLYLSALYFACARILGVIS